MDETIEYAVEEEVAVLRLNRPTRLNSMNTAMRSELRAALYHATQDARAILLTGNGRAFCAGQDLGDVDPSRGADLEGILRQEYEPIVRAICDSPVPVVCAVNGIAAGAGANLALSADIVLAARSASFVEAFARIGLLPDAGGTYWLPRLVGLPRAMAMCLLAKEVDAATAAEWGLIWSVVEDDRLEEEAMALARQLAEGPTVALRLARQALRASVSNDLDSQLDLEARLQSEAAGTQDFLEGVSAFLEKRPPRFQGR